MNISYTGRHTKVSDEMKEYFEKRMHQKVKYFFDNIIQVNLIVEIQRGQYNLQLKVKAEHDTYNGTETKTHWDEAIDSVTDKVASAVKKKKGRVTDHH